MHVMFRNVLLLLSFFLYFAI